MEKNLTLILAVIAAIIGILLGTGIVPLPDLIPLYIIPYFVLNGVVGFAILAFIGWDAWSGKNFLLKYFKKYHAQGGVIALSLAFFLGLLFMTNNITVSLLVGAVAGYLELKGKKKK